MPISEKEGLSKMIIKIQEKYEKQADLNNQKKSSVANFGMQSSKQDWAINSFV